MSKLTILRTTEEDEGMYHCAVLEWNENKWSGTYLSVQGNSERTSNLTVIQRPTVSDPLRPGDLMTLQCSVLSDSENKTCPGGHSVFWLRTQIEKSHPDIIYTGGNRRDECDERSDAQKSCVHHFSKSVSSSDDGTYDRAVATCGRILFGDGTTVDIKENCSLQVNAVIYLLCGFLALSLIVITFLIYGIKKNNSDCCSACAVHKSCDGWGSQLIRNLKKEEAHSAVIFTTLRSKEGAVKDVKLAERERIYAAVKAFGLD